MICIIVNAVCPYDQCFACLAVGDPVVTAISSQLQNVHLFYVLLDAKNARPFFISRVM